MPLIRSGRNSPVWPLKIGPTGRYLIDASNRPFILHGDTAWSIAGALTDAEIDQYLDDRASRGFTAILFGAPEAYYTNQTPSYNNVDGVAPFTSMSPVAWTSPVEAYWTRVDRVVNRCKSLNMACLIFPAYMGYDGGSDGWGAAFDSISDADLQTYGAWIANRLTQRNVIWAMGGDYQGTLSARVTKQWNIAIGILSVRPNDIITGHGYKEAYSYWSAKSGWNLNSTYFAIDDGSYFYTECATAYARSAPIPFFHLEGRYEQEGTPTVSAADLRRQNYLAYLSGACGFFFGNSPVWHFGSSRAPFSYTGTWQTNLASTGSVQQQYVRALFLAYSWWKLVPTTDASLVSSSLSTGATRLYPALASDGTFAMIYVPSSQTVTVVTTALTGISGNVRIRLYDPATGAYTVNQASIAKSSAQSVATGGEVVIVVDAP